MGVSFGPPGRAEYITKSADTLMTLTVTNARHEAVALSEVTVEKKLR